MNKFLYTAFLLFSMLSFSQVGIGTSTPNASAQLDVNSTNKGLLPPRMTYAEKAVIPAPANGLIVFCTDCGTNGELQIYAGSWIKFSEETASSGKPSAPRNPTATAGNTQATISFEAPLSDGGSAITGYRVTISPGDVTRPTPSSPFIFTGLANGDSFEFTVKAVTANGESPSSERTAAVTPATVPGIPTNVSATAGNGIATVVFTPPLISGGATITTYTVNSNPVGFTATGAGILTGNGNELKLEVSGLTVGVPYTFHVIANNAVGFSSPSSESGLVTPYISAICDGSVPTTVSEITSTTGKTWMDRNLGASRAAISLTDYLAYGCLYQWGRGNDGHASINRVSSSTSVAVYSTTPNLSGSDSPGDALFITNTNIQNDWRNPTNNNLWQEGSQINNPCPIGFRVPTYTEFDNEVRAYAITSGANAYSNGPNGGFKFTNAGTRGKSNGTIVNSSTNGYYWTSTVFLSVSSNLFLESGLVTLPYSARSYGSSVRCIKN